MLKLQPLFCEYLEYVDRSVFGPDFGPFWKRCVGGRHGIYVLYRGRHPYYAGLAHDLWRRLKQHLNDRHADSWDRVSVFMTTDARQLHELEALAHHILRPIIKGIGQVGKFPGSKNLLPPFLEAVKQDQDRKRLGLGKMPQTKAKPKPATADTVATAPILAKYANEVTGELRGERKGTTHRARLRADGQIRFNGTLYQSPSGAATAAVGRACDGWTFWKFEKTPGYWVPLGELRRPKLAMGASA